MGLLAIDLGARHRYVLKYYAEWEILQRLRPLIGETADTV